MRSWFDERCVSRCAPGTAKSGPGSASDAHNRCFKCNERSAENRRGPPAKPRYPSVAGVPSGTTDLPVSNRHRQSTLWQWIANHQPGAGITEDELARYNEFKAAYCTDYTSDPFCEGPTTSDVADVAMIFFPWGRLLKLSPVLSASAHAVPAATVQSRSVTYSKQSASHVYQHGHAANSPRVPGKSRFRVSEGGQKFTDEVMNDPNVVVVNQANGRVSYTVNNLGRGPVGWDRYGNPAYGGQIIVEGPAPASWSTYVSGEVVTQYPK